MPQMEYRLLSARPPGPSAPVPYLPDDDPSHPRRTREPLGQYPYLRRLALGWLDRYDDAALDEADAFLTSHADDLDAERAAHDLSVYLCDWVVANSDAARWILNPGDGTCCVKLGDNWLDPYRYVVTCVADRQPVAHRFIEQARRLGA